MPESVPLDSDQSRAVDLVVAAARRADAAHQYPQVIVVSGPAGTGKTTTLRAMAETLDYAPLVLAPTNRAALRVRKHAGLPAITIHKFLYRPVFDESSGSISFKRRDSSELVELAADAEVVIVDEASMVNEEVSDDLHTACEILDLPLVFVGDGFQLPPVGRRDGRAFSVFAPDFECDHRVDLTQIHRGTSTIIQAATLVRAGRVRDGLAMLPRATPQNLIDVASDAIERDGFVICHTNKARQALNFALRSNFGVNGPLAPGEPLMVTRNAYEIERYNGQVVPFHAWVTAAEPHYISRRGYDAASVNFAVADVDGSKVVLCIEEVGGTLSIPDWIVAQEGPKWAKSRGHGYKWKDEDGTDTLRPYPYLSTNLGWAMTCHKAQGDERPHVVVCVEPSIRFDDADPVRAQEATQWIYTAITRAQERCTVFFGSVQRIDPPRRRRTLKPPPPRPARILMVADATGSAAEALTAAANGTMIPATSPLVELVESAADAAGIARDYAGLVSGPNPDAAARLLAAAFTAKGATALRFTGTAFEPFPTPEAA